MKVYTRTSTEESGVLSPYPTENLGPEQMLHLVSQALGEATSQTVNLRNLANELLCAIEQHVDNRIANQRKEIMTSGAWPDSTDAMVWAKMFCQQQKERNQPGNLALMGADPVDPGFMVSWFANAMGTASRQNDNLLADVREHIQAGAECPMCSYKGQGRQTKGMVCELCLTDYGAKPSIVVEQDHVTFTNCTLVEIPYDESPPPIECIHGKHHAKDLPMPLAKGQIIRHTDCTFYGSGQAFSGSWANVRNEPPFELGGEFLRND